MSSRQRFRPDWQDHTGLLASKSFPSGHASSSGASAGTLIVLAWTQLRHPAKRWLATGVLVATWLLVCLDRVLLGRHYPTDVVAGSALGVAVMLIGLALFNPVLARPSSNDRTTAAR